MRSAPSRGRSSRYGLAPLLVAPLLLALVRLPSLAAEPLAPEVARERDVAPDPAITDRVKAALFLSADVDGTEVRVDTVDGDVTLHGVVDSEAAKRSAEAVARGERGVRHVRNLLVVVPRAWQPAVEIGDDALRRRAETALRHAPGLPEDAIRVESVSAGVVVLGGRVERRSEYRRALETVRRLQGVKRVASVVKTPESLRDEEVWRPTDEEHDDGLFEVASDAWITTEAKVRLISNPKTPALDVNVDTHDGVVTLFGTVPTVEAKRAAETATLEIDGVRSVQNALQVVPPSAEKGVAARDEQILEEVERRLDRRPALAASDIEVEVSDGVVRLSGEVTSRLDQLQALTAARVTPGVRSVRDDLRLDRG